jgi:hypothetical protein
LHVTHVTQQELVDFLSARKADLKKGFQHFVVVVVLVAVVGTRLHESKNSFRLLKGIQCEMLELPLSDSIGSCDTSN